MHNDLCTLGYVANTRLCIFAAGRGPDVARAPARRAPALAPAAAAAPALAPRHDRCRGQDLVLHPKIQKNLTRHTTHLLCIH